MDTSIHTTRTLEPPRCEEDALLLINHLVTYICQLYRDHDPTAQALHACLEAACGHATTCQRHYTKETPCARG
jgi:hypothetical protein